MTLVCVKCVHASLHIYVRAHTTRTCACALPCMCAQVQIWVEGFYKQRHAQAPMHARTHAHLYLSRASFHFLGTKALFAEITDQSTSQVARQQSDGKNKKDQKSGGKKSQQRERVVELDQSNRAVRRKGGSRRQKGGINVQSELDEVKRMQEERNWMLAEMAQMRLELGNVGM